MSDHHTYDQRSRDDRSLGSQPAWGPARLVRFLPVIVVVGVLGGALGLAFSYTQPVRYTATTSLYGVSSSIPGLSGTLSPGPSVGGLVAALATATTSETVLTAAADDLGMPERSLASAVSATTDVTSNVTHVSATGSSGAEAANRLRAVIKSLGALVVSDQRASSVRTQATIKASIHAVQVGRNEARAKLAVSSGSAAAGLRASIRQAGRELTTLRERLATVSLDAATTTAESTFYQPAPIAVPTTPSSPLRSLDAGVGAVLAVLVGTGWAWRRAERGALLRDPAEVAQLAGVPFIDASDPDGQHGAWSDHKAGPRGVRLASVLRSCDGLSEDPAPVVFVRSMTPAVPATGPAVALALQALHGRRQVLLSGVHLRTPRQRPVEAVPADGQSRELHSTGSLRWRSHVPRRSPSVVIVAAPPLSGGQYLDDVCDIPDGPSWTVLVVGTQVRSEDLHRALELLKAEGGRLIGVVAQRGAPERSDGEPTATVEQLVSVG